MQSSPDVTDYLVWNKDQWCDSVSSARVNPSLNAYLEKSRGKTRNVLYDLPPTRHYTLG